MPKKSIKMTVFSSSLVLFWSQIFRQINDTVFSEKICPMKAMQTYSTIIYGGAAPIA